jgi:hypothetical protein
VTRSLVFCIPLVLVSSSLGEQPKKESPSWFRRIASFLGVDKTPRALKGLEAASPGEIWIVSVNTPQPRRLTEEADFQSPVLQPGTGLVYALRGDNLVRVSEQGSPQVVASLPGILKLVGFDEKGDQLLTLFSEGAGHVGVVLWLVSARKQEVIAENLSLEADEAASSLAGWDRRYGDLRVSVESGDVLLRGSGFDGANVTNCRPARCGQPSYSPELQRVVYIKIRLKNEPEA